MKLLPSPSLSSSSTSSVSYQSNVCTTSRATISCLAGLLRRMLCTRSLPTYPSDQIIEEPNLGDARTGHRAASLAEKDSSPGIVARLMGLESLPEAKAPACSVSRSRSMSSVERWPDEYGRERDRHRRVENSLSFREMPAFLELKDEEFFVLSFESGEGSKESWSKQKDHPQGCCRRRGNAAELSEEAGSVGVAELSKPRRKVKGGSRKSFGIKKAEAEECSSEDASPVSVLDFGDWITDPDEATAASDDSTMDGSSTRSRRKLSPELENTDHSAASGDGSLIGGMRTPEDEENCINPGSWKNNFNREMWSEICKIADLQIVESDWKSNGTRKQLGDAEGVGVDLGLQVLDQLLDEIVDQLVGRVEH